MRNRIRFDRLHWDMGRLSGKTNQYSYNGNTINHELVRHRLYGHAMFYRFHNDYDWDVNNKNMNLFMKTYV